VYTITREPAPLLYERIQLGDVGYIRKGCFHLLFSASHPFDERQLGVDVPRTFKQLDIGPIFNTQPREPGYLSAGGVREAETPRLTPSKSDIPYVRSVASVSSGISYVCSRILEPGSSFSFKLTEDQGAALVTKYRTYSEDIQRMGVFEKYTKDHYDSWVTFARKTGHGNDINPVLVTGVDMTKDFAMISYSNNGSDKLTSKFTTLAPGTGSAWGVWRTTGSVYKNCGPNLSRPPSPTQTVAPTPPGTGNAETVLDDGYNQCVFIRYYTMHKRLGFPKFIKAAAGPHDLGPGSRDNEESPLYEQYDSDSDSEIASSLFDDDDDDDDDDDRNSVTSIESESDIVVHNTTPVRSFPCHSAPILIDPL
jgi:hypothetical protein